MSTATDYDYTLEDGVADFEFGGSGDLSYGKGADEIAGDRVRKDPPAGDHEFVVSGFLKAPERKAYNAFVDGKSVSYGGYSVGVRLTMVNDPTASVIDFMQLPGDTPADVHAFLNASKSVDGKNKGFMADKLGFFLDRIGFAVTKGKPLEGAAKRPANWLGRKLVATIEMQEQKDPATGQPKCDPTTMLPYPPRASVKLFSYRPHPDTLAGKVPPIRDFAPRQAQQPQASAPFATQQPVQTNAANMQKMKGIL